VIKLKDILEGRVLEKGGVASDFWWMDSNGNLIPVSGLGHAQKGGEILQKHHNITPKLLTQVFPEMYKLGYIRVGFAGMMGEYYIEINYDSKKPPTLKQWRELKDLAIEKGASNISDDTGRRTIRID
jgi:hypothetical protein